EYAGPGHLFIGVFKAGNGRSIVKGSVGSHAAGGKGITPSGTCEPVHRERRVRDGSDRRAIYLESEVGQSLTRHIELCGELNGRGERHNGIWQRAGEMEPLQHDLELERALRSALAKDTDLVIRTFLSSEHGYGCIGPPARVCRDHDQVGYAVSLEDSQREGIGARGADNHVTGDWR